MTGSRITIDPEVMAGQPCIRGMRVTVDTVAGLLELHPDKEILELYPYLQKADLDAVRGYLATMTFAQQLRSLRKRLGIIQPEAAAICEENVRTWKAYELGNSTPKPCHQEGILARLARAAKEADKWDAQIAADVKRLGEDEFRRRLERE